MNRHDAKTPEERRKNKWIALRDCLADLSAALGTGALRQPASPEKVEQVKERDRGKEKRVF